MKLIGVKRTWPCSILSQLPRDHCNAKSPILPWTMMDRFEGSNYSRLTWPICIRRQFHTRNTLNYCSSKAKIRESHFTFAHNWRRIILSDGSGIYKPQICRVITHFLSAIRFLKIKITSDNLAATWPLLDTKRHLLCKFVAEQSRDTGITQGFK